MKYTEEEADEHMKGGEICAGTKSISSSSLISQWLPAARPQADSLPLP